MPFEIFLPPKLKNQGWRIKISDKEMQEEPHVTIIHRTRRWRVSLITGEFLDKAPAPKDVPGEITARIEEEFETLQKEWDARYPHNTVEEYKEN